MIDYKMQNSQNSKILVDKNNNHNNYENGGNRLQKAAARGAETKQEQ